MDKPIFHIYDRKGHFSRINSTSTNTKINFLDNGKWISLLIASGLFGLAHIAGGWDYVIISTIAGIDYGLIY